MISIFYFLLVVLTTYPAIAADPVTPPAFPEHPISTTLFKQLRSGGYVLYMRHGNTDTTRPDRVPSVDLNDCSTQRPLTEEGRQVSAEVGKAIRNAGIPVGEVYSSPLCRAKESAKAAFGTNFTVDNLLMYTANMTSDEKGPVIERTRTLLTAPVPKGSNRIIVAHAPNLMDLMGYFPKPEGTVVVFRHRDAGFEYLGSIWPQQWPELLR